MAKLVTIAEIAQSLKDASANIRTLNRYSDAIVAHMETATSEREAKRTTKSLGQVFNGATKGRNRVTPGMIRTLANNVLAQLPGLREDAMILRGTSAKVKTDSAMIRNGGGIVTEDTYKKLEDAANRFIKAYDGFRADAVIESDADNKPTLVLDVVSETAEVVA